MSNNPCPHPTTTSKSLPLESSLPDGSDRRRDATAQWQVCTRCGAGFYHTDVWARLDQAPAVPPMPATLTQETRPLFENVMRGEPILRWTGAASNASIEADVRLI